MVSAGNVVVEVSANTKKLNQGLKKAKADTKKFGFDIKRVAETAIGFGVAGAVGMAVEAVKTFVKESVLAYAEYERATVAFNAIVGKQADVMLTDLRNASKGMISDFSLMQTANKALMLGISENQLPELMEVATVRAKVMGISATQAFNDISIGIGRQSRLILDNLGFLLDLDVAYENYARTINKTTAELTMLEQREAIANEIINQSKTLMEIMAYTAETTADRLDKLSAEWVELKLTIGEGIVTVGTANEKFIEFASKVIAARGSLKKLAEMDEAIVFLQEMAEETAGYTRELADLNKELDRTKSKLSGVFTTPTQGELLSNYEIAEKQFEIDKEEQRLRQEFGSISSAEKGGETDKLNRLNKEMKLLQGNLDILQSRKGLSESIKDIEEDTYGVMKAMPGTMSQILDEGYDPWGEKVNIILESHLKIKERIGEIPGEYDKIEEKSEPVLEATREWNELVENIATNMGLIINTMGSVPEKVRAVKDSLKEEEETEGKTY